MSDVNETALNIEKDITIDLGGKTYTIVSEVATYSLRAVAGGLQLAEGKNVTITNGTIKSDDASVLISNSANLTLDGVTLDTSNVEGAIALSNNAGTTEIINSDITGEVTLVAGTLTEDYCKITLNSDGTVTAVMAEEKTEGTWEKTGNGKISLTFDGESQIVDCDGKTLVIEIEGSTLTLKK